MVLQQSVQLPHARPGTGAREAADVLDGDADWPQGKSLIVRVYHSPHERPNREAGQASSLERPGLSPHIGL